MYIINIFESVKGLKCFAHRNHSYGIRLLIFFALRKSIYQWRTFACSWYEKFWRPIVSHYKHF